MSERIPITDILKSAQTSSEQAAEEAAARAEKVRRLKDQVRAGTYRLDSRELALLLLDDDRTPLV